jgi:prevent-host-death family protein
MRKIGSREFKNRMGRYLRAVRKGQTLIITDRGKVVAKVAPADQTDATESILDEGLNKLHAQGLIRLARKPFPKFRPAKGRGKPASQIIIEDRR